MPQVPPHFADDLFSALPAQERPSSRWLLAGPRGGGTPLHVDPNGTSAWNALVVGCKLWCMFPPNIEPPARHWNLSVAHWFADVFATMPPHAHAGLCVFVQQPGEIIYVPSGWPHAVLNLETSVGVTHNRAERENLDRVRAHGRPELLQSLRAAGIL
jgi:hypothetical protein